ncbi:MAG: hypothetical protein H7296_02545 [Bacteroidia bacterium]|nr:hypothetical protein [Bacteroidia bacterium]
MKEKLVTFYLSLFFNSLIFAQSSPEIQNPVSPTAAAFAKYIDIPIGEATGIPPIHIPLNEINDPGLSLSISLDYHAGGHKVNDVATHVGLGWSLNAGGQISRAVNGLPDDFTEGYWNYYQSIPNHFLYYNNSSDFNFMRQVANGLIDTEPDMFYYNFDGMAGKFFLDPVHPDITKPRTGQTIPLSNLKIEYFDSKFKITNVSGVVYEFSVTETVTEGSSDPVTYVSSWLLNRVSNPVSDNTINFIYDEPVNIIYPIILSQTLDNFVSQSGSFASDLPNYCQDYVGIKNAYLLSAFSQRRLNKITFTGGYFLFVKGASRTDLANDYILEYIKKYTSTDELVTEYKFQYTYKGNRLHLNKIFEGKNGTYLPPTEFVYNTLDLPPLNSFAQDHWGFYNGKNNVNFIPKDVISKPYFYFANREPNEISTKASNLEQIIYSGGGTVTYEYEQNKYGIVSGNSALSYATGIPAILNTSVSVLGGESNSETYTLAISFPQTIIVAFSTTFGVGAPTYQIVDKTFNILSGTQSLTYTQVDINTRQYNLAAAGNYTIQLTAYSEFSDATYRGIISFQSGLIFKKSKDGPGLRVKNILKSDGTGNVWGRNYTYQMDNENDRSSGILLGNPNYLQQINEYHSFTGNIYCGFPCYIMCNSELVSSQTSVGVGKVNGSYIVYKQVVSKETNPNFSSLSNGYIRRYFATLNNLISSGRPVINSLFPNYLYGYLLKEQIFDNDDLKRKEIIYNYVTDINCGSAISKGFAVCKKVFGISPTSSLGLPFNMPIYQWKNYVISTSWLKLTSITESDISNNNNNQYVNKKVEYFYENLNHMLITKKVTTMEETVIMDEYRYPGDMNVESISISNTNSDVIALKSLVSLHILNVPIEVVSSKRIGTLYKTTKATLFKWKLNSLRPQLFNEYKLKLSQPMSGFLNCSLTAAGLVYNSNYFEISKINAYSKYGSPGEMVNRGFLTSSLYADHIPYKIAESANASINYIGYCGFEDYECKMNNGTANLISGNLSLIRSSASCNPLSYNDAYSGNNGFILGGTCNAKVANANLLNIGSYKLLFWLKSGGSFSVYNGTVLSTTFQILKEINGWILYEYTLTDCSSFSITGAGVIDEVKYYPSGAFMKSWVYKSLVGVLSETSISNFSTHYDYDNYNRLDKVLSDEKKIIKKFIYNLRESQ